MEGLRAVAIVLVVLFHAGVPRITGGYVGSRRFLRRVRLRDHRASPERTCCVRKESLVGILRTPKPPNPSRGDLGHHSHSIGVVSWLGFLVGDDTARVGRTASLFYANFHFIATETNYLASQAPPSALQNYWSLSVEEQFYLLYPTLFILAALSWKRVSIRLKLTILLVSSIVVSFAWSIHQTSDNSVAAFFSPFTRAWELALGALVAVASVQLARLPRTVAAVMTWAGLVGILVAAFTYNSATRYPGVAVALPVISTALIVAGGMARPVAGAEFAPAASPIPVVGKALLFALPVALAHFDHRSSARRPSPLD